MGERGNTTPRPLYSRKRDPVPIVGEGGWAPDFVCMGVENLAGMRTPEGPTHSWSLYRLRPGSCTYASINCKYLLHTHTHTHTHIKTVTLDNGQTHQDKLIDRQTYRD